jgi:PPK2 family polyphosphate:nucleotide phosphotransferase
MRDELRASPTVTLAHIDPDSTPGFTGKKKDGEKALAKSSPELADLQERLFAESKFGGHRRVLLVLQAMDTAGKGGMVRHALGGVDPAGVRAHAFKAPTDEEKKHDFLWRIRKQLPPPGYIGVFDRSHYEDVLIHRVHNYSTPAVIEERYGLITEFETELAAAGTTLIKVMLHISSDEQKSRLAARLDRGDKQWKYSPGDVDERRLWDDYQQAYEIAIRRTTTDVAPWFVVPANHKWYARYAVHKLVLEHLQALNPGWPKPDYDVEVEKARLAAT